MPRQNVPQFYDNIVQQNVTPLVLQAVPNLILWTQQFNMACTHFEAPSVAGSAQSPLAKLQCNQPAWIRCPDWSFIFMHFYLYKTLNSLVFEYYIFQINLLLT
jgi:hypothetical protein